MTFLSPLPALTAAAITVPILLALYLLKLRRRPVRVGSIMFWPLAKEDAQANVPFRWLRPSWLLLLHILILAAFLLALARPVLTDGVPPSQRIIFLLDTSASMSAVDDGSPTTRLDRAKSHALALIDQLQRSSGRRAICLVSFAAEARAQTGFTSSRAALAAALDSLSPTDQPGNLGAALKLTDALAIGDGEEPADGAEPPTVILLSDGSFRDQGRLPSSAARLRFERIGPPLPEPDTSPSGPASALAPANLGIVGLAARRDPQDPGIVRVFIDLLNTAATPASAPLTLSINGVAVERRAIDLPASTPSAPGRATTTFELKNDDGGVLLITIPRPDALAADNSASLVLPPAQRASILLVEPDAAPNAPITAATWILQDVLTELRSRSFTTVPISEYERRAATGALSGIDLIVFDRTAPTTLPPIPTISFGEVPPLPGIRAGATGQPTSILFWQRPHPILRNVAFDAVVISQTTQLSIAPQTPGTTADLTVTELMRGVEGPLLLLIQDGAPDSGGIRRLIAPFALSNSNWPLQAGFPIFLADAVDYLTLRADASTGRAFKTDEPAQVRIKPNSTGRIAIKGPIDLILRPANSPASPSGVLSAGLLPRAGIYIVEGDSALDRALAVNLTDDAETALASPTSLEVGSHPIEGVTSAAVPQEVWQYFIIAAAALLAVEWFIYARSIQA